MDSKLKSEIVKGDTKLKDDIDKYVEMDEKAKANIKLCMSSSEMKQIENYGISSDT